MRTEEEVLSEMDDECSGCVYNGAMDTHAISVCMMCEDQDCYEALNDKDGG